MEHFFGPLAITQGDIVSGDLLIGDKIYNKNPYINVDAKFLSNCDPYSCYTNLKKDCDEGPYGTTGSNMYCRLHCKSCNCGLDKTNPKKCFSASTVDKPVNIKVTHYNNRKTIAPAAGMKQPCITVSGNILTRDPKFVNFNTCTQAQNETVTSEENKILEGFMQNSFNFAPVYTNFPAFSNQNIIKNHWF
jgi:hypothetical protein